MVLNMRIDSAGKPSSRASSTDCSSSSRGRSKPRSWNEGGGLLLVSGLVVAAIRSKRGTYSFLARNTYTLGGGGKGRYLQFIQSRSHTSSHSVRMNSWDYNQTLNVVLSTTCMLLCGGGSCTPPFKFLAGTKRSATQQFPKTQTKGCQVGGGPK